MEFIPLLLLKPKFAKLQLKPFYLFAKELNSNSLTLYKFCSCLHNELVFLEGCINYIS